jgi:hypothetical protein
MSPIVEPNPPSRREEDFPKTTTIPGGWDTQALMECYNPVRPVPTTGGAAFAGASAADASAQPPVQADTETGFFQSFDSFPRPNTIPSGWDLSEM